MHPAILLYITVNILKTNPRANDFLFPCMYIMQYTRTDSNIKDANLKHDTNIHTHYNWDQHKLSYNIPYTRNVEQSRLEGGDNTIKLVLLFELIRSSLIIHTVFCALNVAGTSSKYQVVYD